PLTLFLHCSANIPDLHSFPTRRSSDLAEKSSKHDAVAFAQLMWPAQIIGFVALIAVAGTSNRSLVLALPFIAAWAFSPVIAFYRSEEHTSELQSRFDLVCRLLLEKKKK